MTDLAIPDEFGYVTAGMARRAEARSSRRRYLEPRVTRIIVNCATGERTVERIYQAPMPLKPAEPARISEAIRKLFDLLEKNDRLCSAREGLPAMRAVMRSYVARARAAGLTVDGAPYSMDDLLTHRRPKEITKPRHVCIWLCRRICKTSWSQLGTAFKQDHTSMIHACQRVEDAFAWQPVLRTIAGEVLVEYARRGAQ